MDAARAYVLIEKLSEQGNLSPQMKSFCERRFPTKLDLETSDGQVESLDVDLWPAMVVAILELGGKLEQCETADDLKRAFEPSHPSEIAGWPAPNLLRERALDIHADLVTDRLQERRKYELN